MDCTVIIKGGVGDFILSLDACIILSSRPDTKFLVITHFAEAKSFFSPFVNIEKFEFRYFKDASEFNSILTDVINNIPNRIECPKFKINEFSFPYDVNSPFTNDYEIIGIHPFGSEFYKAFTSSIGKPDKKIPSSVIKSVIRSDKNYIIFGTVDEISEYDDLSSRENVCLCSHKDVWVSLSHLKLCSKLIAADSCFKTLSLTKQIDTYLVINEGEDNTRDSIFINPYINDKHLNLLKVKDVSKNLKEIIDFINGKVYSKI